jgi:hypothetical protein
MLLSLAGVPALYFSSLFGGRNWRRGFEESGQPRSINRQRYTYDQLEAALHEDASPGRRVWARCLHLLNARAHEMAFHPSGRQRVLDLGPALFALERLCPEERGCGAVACLHNVTELPVRVDARALPGLPPRATTVYDLISRQVLAVSGGIELPPYGIAWLKTA